MELIINRMEKKQIKQDNFDKQLQEKTRIEDLLITRQEHNNIIFKFGNFKSFSILSINFTNLDKIKDQYVLGIANKEDSDEEEMEMQVIENSLNFRNNMLEYWGELNK